jgi:hypothetical protein
MPRWSPCKRQDFIRRLHQLGFEGVYSGAKHQFMIIGQNRLTLPSTLSIAFRWFESCYGKSSIYWVEKSAWRSGLGYPDEVSSH